MKKILLLKALKRAFSLVELMISLITISVIVAAMTPVITKKLSSQRIAVGSFGGGGGTVTNLICCNDSVNYSYNPTNSKCEKTNGSGEIIDAQEPIACSGMQFSFECSGIDPNCFACTPDKTTCQICTGGYDLIDGACVSRINCAEKFQTTDCTSCNETVCTLCLKNCADGYFLNYDYCKCDACTSRYVNCAKCTIDSCAQCDDGYKDDEGTCVMEGQELAYTTAGNHSFTVPAGVTELEVTLVSGGAGGGGGTTAATKTWSFVESGNANITANANNKVFNKNTSDSSISYSNGIFSWTIPDELKGKDVKVSACGGGGGIGYSDYDVWEWLGDSVGYATYGGNGGAYRNQTFTMPEWDASQPLKIHIGGAGGGINWKRAYNGDYELETTDSATCSLSGRVDMSTSSTIQASCNATDGWGSGASYVEGAYSSSSIVCAKGGYDPFDATGHGVGGGNGGRSGITKVGLSATTKTCDGGKGSIIGGGGGGVSYVKDSSWFALAGGGGGGGATMFYHNEFKNNSALIASGGGGGAGCYVWGSSDSAYIIFGGGGGGGGGPNGGAGGNNVSQYNFSAGKPGGGSNNSDFGNSYCKGGSITVFGEYPIFNKASGGAMRISYTSTDTGASGGGAGAIVPAQKISVTPGETLTITVGAGGNGGNSGVAGSLGGVSKITRSNGSVLLSTASGQTGGNPDGSIAGNAGYITNGLNETQIAIANYSTATGENGNSTAGGAGGRTTIAGVQNHCTPGGGGAANTAGGSASGYGGCAGGGGGSGKAGGSGAPGYVKIVYGG